MKAIALIWIFLAHLVIFPFGYNQLGNPVQDWPPLAERLEALTPLGGSNILVIIGLNTFRYISWCGEQGVNIFLILSGFGLTWGLLQKKMGTRFPIFKFYFQRLRRILPLWWGIHLLFVLTFVLFNWGISPYDPLLYLSLLGIRFTPDTFFFFCPAWWFVGLLLQLYLLFPLLWIGLKRFGPLKLLLIVCAIALPIRAFGLLTFGSYIDEWHRGAIFITRLPEFVFGISLAAWMYQNPSVVDYRLRAKRTLIVAVCLYVLGLVLSLFVLGVVIAPLLLGVGAFIIFYAVLSSLSHSKCIFRTLSPLGQHSYSLYLVHQVVLELLIPTGAIRLMLIQQTLFAIILSIVFALSLEFLVERFQGTLKDCWVQFQEVRKLRSRS